MKMRVTFKTPDSVQHAIAEEMADAVPDLEAREELLDKLKNVTDKFVSYGELVTIEFDSEAGTAIVVERK